MSTLLMRLAAPLQSWGTESKFDVRRTEKEPSKSGVIGLVAAALGIRRDENEKIERLSGLRFGVRVDKEGVMIRDYHIAKSGKDTYVTNRYYLSDAVFVVGLESTDEGILYQIEEALSHPVFPLYLGRRSCPPTGKLSLGITPLSLEEALSSAPIQNEKADAVRIVIEAKKGNRGSLLRDQPVSFNSENRQYAFRQAIEMMVLPEQSLKGHDPMAELE